MRRVRWGIAGHGLLASDFAEPALRALENGVLEAVYDVDPSARSDARTDGLRAYPTYDALLESVDAVYVATPNDQHRKQVERAAARGKHVLCEKPMATSLADCDAMLAACARADVAYATAYDQRHHPAHERMHAEIAAGRVGTVTGARIVYACWLPRDWAEDNWRVDRARSGGGALVDLVPHGLDLIETLLDDEVARAHALGQRRVQDYDVDDGAMVVARTRRGVLAQLHVAYNYPETLPRRRLEITGTRGVLTAENTMGQTPGGSLAYIDAVTGASRLLAFDAKRSPFEGLVAAFTDRVAAGGRFDALAAVRERAACALLVRLLEDVRPEALA